MTAFARRADGSIRDGRNDPVHDIITDLKSVEEVGREYAETTERVTSGESPASVQRFQFDLPEGDQRHPDEAIVDEQNG